jgi:crotonobetainyl-CoA:carnitine CoA-transferase CaiB-like acyl-CoA transferase
MTNLLLSLRAAGGLPEERGRSMLDGAPFYGVYACADGKWISIGPLEPKFYALLLEKLGLSGDPLFADQFDAARWPAARARLAALFASEPRAHWERLLLGTDVCFAPVLAPSEAAAHPHISTRAIYREIGGILQAAAAPRFNGAIPPDPAAPSEVGQHTDTLLAEFGMTRTDIDS